MISSFLKKTIDESNMVKTHIFLAVTGKYKQVFITGATYVTTLYLRSIHGNVGIVYSEYFQAAEIRYGIM